MAVARSSGDMRNSIGTRFFASAILWRNKKRASHRDVNQDFRSFDTQDDHPWTILGLPKILCKLCIWRNGVILDRDSQYLFQTMHVFSSLSSPFSYSLLTSNLLSSEFTAKWSTFQDTSIRLSSISAHYVSTHSLSSIQKLWNTFS